jgi:hypothetical protein
LHLLQTCFGDASEIVASVLYPRLLPSYCYHERHRRSETAKRLRRAPASHEATAAGSDGERDSTRDEEKAHCVRLHIQAQMSLNIQCLLQLPTMAQHRLVVAYFVCVTHSFSMVYSS